jgi:hypothetical protein
MAIASDFEPYRLHVVRLTSGAHYVVPTQWFTDRGAREWREIVARIGIKPLYCIKVTPKVPRWR